MRLILTHLSMVMHFIVTLNQEAHKCCSFNEKKTKSHLDDSHLFAYLVIYLITNFKVNGLQLMLGNIKAYN